MSNINNKSVAKTKEKTTPLDVVFIVLLITELIFVITGPYRIQAGISLFITFILLGIVEDRKKAKITKYTNRFYDSQIGNILKEMDNEIKIIKKSGKQLKFSDDFNEKVDEIILKFDKLVDKYFFIKESYGFERAKEELDKLQEIITALVEDSKKINNNFLKLYATTNQDTQLIEELNHIVDTLDASVSLKDDKLV